MQACDRATTERFGIPSIQLMRAASAAVAAFARQQFPRARRVTVLCGRGNNGGDGMMAARLLADGRPRSNHAAARRAGQLTGDAGRGVGELTSPMHGAVHVVASARETRSPQRCARSRSHRRRRAGHRLQASAQGPGAGGARMVASASGCSGSGCRFALRLAGRRNRRHRHRSRFSRRCRHHLHRAQSRRTSLGN